MILSHSLPSPNPVTYSSLTNNTDPFSNITICLSSVICIPSLLAPRTCASRPQFIVTTPLKETPDHLPLLATPHYKPTSHQHQPPKPPSSQQQCTFDHAPPRQCFRNSS